MPVSAVRVALTVADIKLIQVASTDSSGRYVLLVDADDSALGRSFTLTVGDQSKVIQLLFNPSDRNSNRGQRVDFILPIHNQDPPKLDKLFR